MRIAVVTGASSGLGREFVRQIPRLYRNLDELWVVARRTQRLKELEGEVSIPLRIFDGDLQRDYIYERIERELSRHTPDIRMLVNGAGYGKVGDMAGTAWQEKEDRWEEKVQAERREQLGQIDINCRALTRMIQICLPYQEKGSRILNIASAAAFAPQPGFAVYAAAKAYVYRLSLALGEELKERGISVTVLCPGPVDTEFFDRSGVLPGSLRKAAKAAAEDVVRQGLLDGVRRKSVSTYGVWMKAARIGAKLVPGRLCAAFLKTINQSGAKEE